MPTREDRRSPTDAERLFAALTELGGQTDLLPMLDRICDHIVALGMFRGCVLGVYTADQAGYGVGGCIPEGTRERFHLSFQQSTPEGRSRRRNDFLAHRVPGTHIVFLPAGAGPEWSNSGIVTHDGEGSWKAEDRLMILVPVRGEVEDPNPLFATLTLDEPVSGNRPDEETLRRLRVVEHFLRAAAVLVENRLLAGRINEANRRYREVFASIPAAVALVDGDGRILLTNRDGRSAAGRDSLGAPGGDIRDLGWPPPVGEALESLVTGAVDRIPAQDASISGPGGIRSVLLTGAAITPRSDMLSSSGTTRRVVVVVEDVSELRSVQARLRESRKMGAVGRLAGGVAHEFNNLLCAVLGNIELSQHLLSGAPNPSVERLLADAHSAAQRGGVLTHQLLAFARPTQTGFRPFDVRRTVRDAVSLLRRTTHRRVRISTRFGADVPAVSGDPSLLEQAILNLCLKSVDALEERIESGAGADPAWSPVLGIRVVLAAEPGPGLPSPAVCVTVADNGAGMSAEEAAQVFEPFAGESRDGGPVGLAMSWGVIRQHGGEVQVESAPGVGTTFRVWLPATDEPVPAESQEPEAHPAPASGKLLVVDDDDLVRQTYRHVLGQFGFDVTSAESGVAALDLLRHRGGFDAMVLDLSMPDLDGLATLEQARAECLSLPPVLLVSGDPTRVAGVALEDLGIRRVLTKPFRTVELVEQLRRLV